MKLRRTLLTLLPKFLLSRTTGLLTRIPLPSFARKSVYGWYARRYGVDLADVARPLEEYRSLRAFFVRQLPDGARPIGDHDIVWPCDGRIVTSGRIRDGRIQQVKGTDYALTDLVVDAELASQLEGGYQATIYLSPRDYHRVHAPFAGTCTARRHVPGSLFPVNPPAQHAIPRLFARNERVVFDFTLATGTRGAVIMVAALNVGDIQSPVTPPRDFVPGEELGYFGFGSTTIVLLGPGGPAIPELDAETPVLMGGNVVSI